MWLVFLEHKYLLNSQKLNNDDKDILNNYISLKNHKNLS